MGYLVESVTGTPPFALPTGPVRAIHGVLAFAWVDGSTDDQESLDFTLAVRAVDLGGNAGPASDPIAVHSGGTSGGGCAVGVRAYVFDLDGQVLVMGFAMLGLYWRRRFRAKSV